MMFDDRMKAYAVLQTMEDAISLMDGTVCVSNCIVKCECDVTCRLAEELSVSITTDDSRMLHLSVIDICCLFAALWAREHCRISPPRFLAECRKRILNQACFVFVICIVCFFWVVFSLCIFLYCFVCMTNGSHLIR